MAAGTAADVGGGQGLLRDIFAIHLWEASGYLHMSTLSPAELETAFHPLMTRPAHWYAVRYEIDISPSTGLPESVVITFRSSDGVTRKLRFNQPNFDSFSSLQIPAAQNLYVADLSSFGWSSDRHIEVGEWEEERTTMFWAHSVEELA